ncbi:MAG: hypothetical protein R3F20_03685 [Planctomycetota bacterium]
MARSAGFSLIVVGRRHSRRFDFASSRAEGEVTPHEIAASGVAADDVANLAALGPMPRRATVLLDSAWIQTVELPAAAVRGLGIEDLRRAVAFELEGLSGLSSATSEVAVGEEIPGSAGKVRWVAVEVHDETAAGIRSALGERGCGAVTIGHPASLSLASEERIPFVEVHERVTIARDPDRGAVVVIPARPGQRSWRGSVERFVSETDARPIRWQGIVPSGEVEDLAAAFRDEGGLPMELDPVGTARRWARDLSAAGERLPLVGPPRAARRSPGPLAIGIVATAIAIGAVGFLHVRRRREVEDLEARAVTVSADLRRIASAERALAVLRRETNDREQTIRDAEKSLETIAAGFETQRAGMRRLLRGMARLRVAGVAVTSLESRPDGAVEIEGLGATTAAIDAYVSALSGDARLGWEIRPPRCEARPRGDGREIQLYSFRAVPTSKGAVDDGETR